MSRDDDEITRILEGRPPVIETDPEVIRAANEDEAVGNIAARHPEFLRLSGNTRLRPSAGDKNRVVGYAAPGIASSTPPTSIDGTTAQWGRNPLNGPRTLHVGKSSYSIPAESQIRRSQRSGTTWVFVPSLKETFVFSVDGVLVQTPAERRATRFHLL